MFTGIIEEIGHVENVRHGNESAVIEIKADKVLSGTNIGDSIAINGVCLTVTKIKGKMFLADIMHETLNRSSLGCLTRGSRVNLERAMSAKGRFGGHIVTGHIDGPGIVQNVKRDGSAVWYTIKTEPGILGLIVEKGSIAIDGISLTVAKVYGGSFAVSVIPHTAAQTTLSDRKVGDTVNLENDIIGKYIERMLRENENRTGASGITREFLMKSGF